jgi:outer membrane protein OmpA-like peptidoglycan-associated protein
MKRVYFVCGVIALLLAACAQTGARAPIGDELVVVLPASPGHNDGKVGGVIVRRDGAEQLLDKPYAASRIVAEGKPQAAQLNAAEIKEAFGPALAALPGKPATFLVYFLEGKDELTAASNAELKNVFAEIKRRPEPDVMIIGHTDSVGGDAYNDKLSLARAERMRDLLMGLGISSARMQLAGRGKREAMVQTLGGVAEPRNRRVEISVR